VFWHLGGQRRRDFSAVAVAHVQADHRPELVGPRLGGRIRKTGSGGRSVGSGSVSADSNEEDGDDDEDEDKDDDDGDGGGDEIFQTKLKIIFFGEKRASLLASLLGCYLHAELQKYLISTKHYLIS
jgi:hypothetical protein